MKKKINVIALSDTHTKYDFSNTPNGDILIIAGDILMHGSILELQKVMMTLNAESSKWDYILIVPGNHDFALQKMLLTKTPWEEFAKDNNITVYPSNMIISHEGIVELLGLKIFTWSWVPNLPNWAFHLFDNDIEKQLAKLEIPEKVDIVVSHGPPSGVLDWIKKYGAVGSKNMEKQFNFEYNIHIFGHIHENYGTAIRDASDIIKVNGEFRRYYNVSILNEYYCEENEPIKIIINE